MPTLIAVLFGQALVSAFLLPAVGNPLAMMVGLFFWGAAGAAFDAPVQSRILAAARNAPNLAATLVSTAFNIGIGAGAWIGALWIDHGLGYAGLPWIAVVCSLIGTGIAAFSWSLDRRRAVTLATTP